MSIFSAYLPDFPLSAPYFPPGLKLTFDHRLEGLIPLSSIVLNDALVAWNKFSRFFCVRMIPGGLAQVDREIGTEFFSIVWRMTLVETARSREVSRRLSIGRLAVLDWKLRSRLRDECSKQR